MVALFATFQVLISGAAPASAITQPAGQLPSDDPAAFTPHVLDGSVYSVVQVGNTMILGGDFSQVRNNSNTTVLTRNRLVAFDATTGVISTTFAPNPNGTINVVLPAGDGTSVYVGGSFTTISGQSVKNLARINVADGSVVSTFNGGSPTGVVKDLKLSNGHLWVAGAFTHIRSTAQPALATLNPTTGAFDSFYRGTIAGVHKAGSVTNVYKMDVSPDGKRLVAVGNFDTLNGVKNHQLALLDLTGATAVPADFQTNFYEAGCSSSFDTYMRDVDFSPDSTFFVVGTTGAYGGSTAPCDTTARFDVSQTGTSIQPSWIDYTGGDTTYSVEVTNTAVFVGGHQRWQNNAYAGDNAGPGAVSRPGIAALSPVNGIPFSWNPTRTRGVGLFDFLNTSQGLWAVSDTDRIGNYEYHGRVALFPANGTTVPAVSSPAFPNDVYSAGTVGFSSDPRVLYRVNTGGSEVAASKGIDWADDSNGNNVYSTPHNVAGYSTVGSVDSTVPAGTPASIFSSEAWDSWDAQEMTWSFPVPAGTPVEVRLYFANRYSGTSGIGQRVFNVDVDGTRFLNNFDIVAAAGDNTGTMRADDIVSDGSVDISFGHITENPLINGIEIVRTDLPAAASGGLSKRSFNGTVAGASLAVADGGLDWDTVRGAFMVNGYVYLAMSDGSFVRRSYNGSTLGSAQAVNGQDEIVTLSDWQAEASSATGMFYENGRIYFTMSGSNTLYYRYLNVESGIVGAVRYQAASGVSGIDFSKVRGMFLGGSKLYWATVDGNLHSIDWSAGAASGTPVADTAAVVSGPSVDGNSWSSHALFLYQDTNGDGAGQPPVAAFSLNCTGMTCSVDASGSTATGATITSYQWNWGDGASTTGVTSSHTFTARGTFSITLTVTTSKGASSQLTQQVTMNMPPTAAFTSSCTLLACGFDASASSDDAGIASYGWDFGDGATATTANPSHTYATAGSYTVTLTVTDSDGATATKTATVKAVDTPTADFTSDCTSLGCTFDASGSVAPGSTISGYAWSFDDGTAAGTGQKPTHTFPATGTYNVQLTITTAEGLTATVTKAVSVTRVNQAPTAAFSKSCTQLVCSFDASDSSDSDGSIASYAWDFGDGTTGTGKTVNHTFASGSWDVKLTVTDNDGTPDSETMTVVVSSASVSFVEAASANGNKASHVVRIPTSVNAGDRLVLFLTLNSTAATITAPSGWTAVRSTDGSSFLGRVWTKVATASDAGANVTVGLSDYAKGDITVAAYRSTTGTVGVADSAATTASAATSITTPSLSVGSGGIVVNYVGVKAASTVTANLPNDLTQRASSAGSGSGAIYAWGADSGSYLSGGTFGGKSVTFSGTATRALAYGLLLRAQ
ncbi:MAG: PKD domain-containing protein [Propionicimonas sp.]|uniref:PKD domain-containing protein n=1 Tax=Propionicimonas sp. TaxID=1955623 RepID=UPI003D14DC50